MSGPEPQMPSDCLPVQALDPYTRGRWNVYLRQGKIKQLARQRGRALELAYTVREALLAPTAVFRGVREEGERDWLCHVSRPGRAYDYRTGEEVDGWEGQVFLIYVTDDRILYLWVWAQADGDNPNLPVNYASRFEERLL